MTLFPPRAKNHGIRKDSIDQDETAENVQSDLGFITSTYLV